MRQKILDAVRNGDDNVLVVATIDDLKGMVDYLLQEQERHAGEDEDVIYKDDLMPCGHWVKKLHIDRSTLWRWEKEGRIKPTRFGNRLYFRESDFVNIGKRTTPSDNQPRGARP